MDFHSYSPYVVAGFTVVFVLFGIEIGILLGRFNRRKDEEKEAQTSTLVGAMLGLVAFMLAFTFGHVANRFDDRKALVRDEANAIGTAYLRSAFLPEAEQARVAGLFRNYLDLIIEASRTRDPASLEQSLQQTAAIENEIWQIAVVEARGNVSSHVAALYIEALNEMIDIRASRIAIAVEGRIPDGIWLGLYALMLLGMSAIGYQTAVTRSRRSWEVPLLAVSFAVVVGLISALDHTDSDLVSVSQAPLLSLKASMAPAPAGPR